VDDKSGYRTSLFAADFQASNFCIRIEVFANPFRVIESALRIFETRSRNSNLYISSLTRKISFSQVNWNVSAGENARNYQFIYANGQSHENNEFVWISQVGL
jgi:hypothetical protein